MLSIRQSKKNNEDDIELLTLLIEKYDEEKMPTKNVDPIALIKIIMKEHNLKSKDIAEILDVNKSTVSRILNYQKGLSKNAIRILAGHFAISQEALNRPYRLKKKINSGLKNTSLMRADKRIESKKHPAHTSDDHASHPIGMADRLCLGLVKRKTTTA